MGTRADFYVGRGPEAEWLGSIAWDGYPDGLPELEGCKTEKHWRELIAGLTTREDWTAPEQGWPWPWENSQTTDFAYAFDDGVKVSCFGHTWKTMDEAKDDESEWDDEKVPFPDMSDRQKVTLGKRSGVIIVGGS